MRDPRHDKLADVLVSYSTRIKKGDVVSIIADPVALPMVRALYERVLRAGGHPHWRANSHDLIDAFYETATDEQLAFVPPHLMHEAQTVDVRLVLLSETNTCNLSRVEPRRLALGSTARRPVMETSMKRAADGEMRWCGTQFPTQACAQDAEMSLTQYEDFVFRAGMLHLADPVAGWTALKERQQRLCDWIQGRKTVRFRNPAPDGSFDTSRGATDITVQVGRSKWINCYGDNNFPDGEIFAGPQGADGVINFTYPAVYHGRAAESVRLEFKGGRVVDAGARKNEDYLIKMLDQDEGARTMGEIAIGTNYEITDFTRNTLFDEKIGGTFHMAVGAGYPESGNSNTSGLHWDMVCDLRKGGTIEADGEVFSRNGRFLKEGWPAPA